MNTSENIKISPRGSLIAKSIAINSVVGNFVFGFIFFVIWIIGLASLVALVANILGYLELTPTNQAYLYLGLAAFLIYFALRLFYLSKLKHPKPLNLQTALEKIEKNEEINLYALFSFELAKVWNQFSRRDPNTKNSDILVEVILNSPDLAFILARIGYSSQAILPYLEKFPENVDLTACVLQALKIAISESHHQIETGDLFVALCQSEKSLSAFLGDVHLETRDIANIVYWQTAVIRQSIKYRKKIFDPDDLHLGGGIGRDWIFGFTPLLAQYARDMTDSIARYGLNLEIIGHDREIRQIEEALTAGRGGNVLLVGEAGVGKKTCVMGFAKKVYEGSAMGELKNKHLLQIDIDALLSRAEAGGDITGRISAILNEAAAAGNMMIFIENIQNLFSSGDAGRVNAAEVILPFLEIPGFHIIGSCDSASYSRYVATNSSLVQRLAKIDIEEPTAEEMVRILEDAVPAIEHHSKSLISYGAIKEAIKAADKYIQNIPNPEKSITLIDGATARAASARGATIITGSDIDDYISEKYDLPSGEVGEEEKSKLLNLEEIMHRRVVGQKEAINAIANAMRRARAGITQSRKPIGSFLFMGTTGVGKTETAKALAAAYFGDENRMIRFDMSEYQNKQDIYRLIGSNVGGEEIPGSLTTAVREHPFSLLLFDELEKASPDILNLFLQILDEGNLTDAGGKSVSFTNTIIIATSNAGANLIKQSIGSGVEYQKLRKELLDFVTNQNIYRPEFLNRFSGVIVFYPLSRPEIEQIAAAMLQKLADSFFNNKGVTLRIGHNAVVKLATIGFDPVMGARPMARTIEQKIEDSLAKKILSGELKKGDSMAINADDII